MTGCLIDNDDGDYRFQERSKGTTASSHVSVFAATSCVLNTTGDEPPNELNHNVQISGLLSRVEHLKAGQKTLFVNIPKILM